MYSEWDSRRSKTGKINLSRWDVRNSESWINIFRKWIEEAFNEEFKKIKNCDEEDLKFRKRSSQNKIKNLQNWDKRYSKWYSKRSKNGKINLAMWKQEILKVGKDTG